MLGAATPQLAVTVSHAGGMGFLAGGTDAKKLDQMLNETTTLLENLQRPITPPGSGILPIGVGFQLFNSNLSTLKETIARHTPAVIWLFAPKDLEELGLWSKTVRDVTNNKTRIWIQVGTVAEAKESLSLANPDVLVIQGTDAGGHGRKDSASIISLVPEVADMLREAGRPDIPILAAGGIVDARGFAAALALGASGVVMGTRFLACEEAGIAMGWKRELLRTQDASVTTVRSTLCDRLKETKGWPEIYDGRMIRNQGHVDENAGMSDEEHVRLYKEELKQGDDAWGLGGRMVAYAGTGVGLIKKTQPAGSIIEEVLKETREALEEPARMLGSQIPPSRL